MLGSAEESAGTTNATRASTRRWRPRANHSLFVSTWLRQDTPAESASYKKLCVRALVPRALTRAFLAHVGFVGV